MTTETQEIGSGLTIGPSATELSDANLRVMAGHAYNEAFKIDCEKPTISSDGSHIIETVSEKLTARQNLIASGDSDLAKIKARQDASVANTNVVAGSPIGYFFSGIKGHYNLSSSFSWSSDFNYSYSQEWNEKLLALICGIEKMPTAYTTDFSTQYKAFVEGYEPRLHYSVSPNCWSPGLISETREYDGSSYSYSNKPFIVFAIKNTSGSDITTTLDMYYSAYGSYSAASIGVFTPNDTNANRTSINGYSFSSVWQYTSSGYSNSGAQNIVVPANKSVIVVCISSKYNYTSYTNVYQLALKDLATTFSDAALVPDIEIMTNMENAYHGRYTSSFDHLAKLWTITPPTNPASQIVNGLVPEYADNAAAVTAGLAVGKVYTNSTTKALSVVV